MIHNSTDKMNRTTSHPNMDIGTISIPILQQFDEVALDSTENEIDSDSIPEIAIPVQINLDDIHGQVDLCYIVGVNPQIHVLEGFIRRIWKNLKVDNVVMVKKVVYLVRFFYNGFEDKFLAAHYFF